jgi:hypothetical protein
VEILGELGGYAADRGDFQRGSRYAEEGLALSKQLEDPDLLAQSLVAVESVAFMRTGRIRRDLLKAAIDIERRPGGGPSATLRAHSLRISSVEPTAVSRWETT